LLILGGESDARRRLAELRELAPQCRVANHYGPPRRRWGRWAGFPQPEDAVRPTAPLGWALPTRKPICSTRRCKPAPAGMPGELVSGRRGGGAGISRVARSHGRRPSFPIPSRRGRRPHVRDGGSRAPAARRPSRIPGRVRTPR
jgi:hypothetical protein